RERQHRLAVPTSAQVYVGTEDGAVFRVNFTGGTWQAAVALGTPRPGFMSDLLVDPSNANRLWGTFSSTGGSHVFRSDNGGTTWNDMSAGLPNLPINAIEIDSANPNTVYVAADIGVYRTTNSGAAWSSFSNGLPNALVKDLFFHQPARLLR